MYYIRLNSDIQNKFQIEFVSLQLVSYVYDDDLAVDVKGDFMSFKKIYLKQSIVTNAISCIPFCSLCIGRWFRK